MGLLGRGSQFLGWGRGFFPRRWAVLPGSQKPAKRAEWGSVRLPLRCLSLSEKRKFSGYQIKSLLRTLCILPSAKWLMTSLLKAGDHNSTLGGPAVRMRGCLRRASLGSPFELVHMKWVIGSRQGKTVTRWPLTTLLPEGQSLSTLPHCPPGKFSSSAFL